MLEHSEIKLSRLVSAFAREALSVLPPQLELPNMLPDLSERVDTLLQITDLCRSGLLQDQQVLALAHNLEQKGQAADLRPASHQHHHQNSG